MVRGPRIWPLGLASDDERAIHIGCWFGADVFDPAPPVPAQHVEAKAVRREVDDVEKPGSECRPLRGIEVAFEHGILDPLTPILACARHGPQSTPTLPAVGGHVVGHQDHHPAAAVALIPTAIRGNRRRRGGDTVRGVVPGPGVRGRAAGARRAEGGEAPSSVMRCWARRSRTLPVCGPSSRPASLPDQVSHATDRPVPAARVMRPGHIAVSPNITMRSSRCAGRRVRVTP